jgi:hypothetical protein
MQIIYVKLTAYKENYNKIDNHAYNNVIIGWINFIK